MRCTNKYMHTNPQHITYNAQHRVKPQSGFTLIEILIVIGIIALLAGIVLVAINPARQFAQARNTERTAHVNAILNAIGQYQVDHLGDIPEGISTSGNEEISSGGANICADIVPVYMAALPRDPATVGDGEAFIDEDGCGGGYETGYTTELVSGRVRVCAPLAADEETLGEDAEAICVTR